jgi:hypothetical protein
MKEFYLLNKRKLFYMFRFCLAVFCLLATIPFFIGALNTVVEGLAVLTVILFISLFAILLDFFIAYNLFLKSKKIFAINGLANFFSNHSFALVNINEGKKFYFTQQAMVGTINGFRVTLKVEPEMPRKIVFCFEITEAKIEKARYKSLVKLFKKHSAKFGWGEIIVSKKEANFNSAVAVENELKQFSNLLINNSLMPKTDK